MSKSASDRASLPWLDLSTGELAVGRNRYRPWSASRRWGSTMAAIKRAQAAWWLTEAAAAAREGPQAPEGGGGRVAGRQAGGVLDPSSANYTLVVPGVGQLRSVADAESADAGDVLRPWAARTAVGPSETTKAAPNPGHVTNENAGGCEPSVLGGP